MNLPVSFQHFVYGADDRLVLFLHGYTDSGSSFVRRALRSKEPKFSLLAPNGPFPLPVKSGEAYKEAYAWYFWEAASDRILIHPHVAAKFLCELVDQSGYKETPKVIVGFSQGGFLAPYVLPELRNVKGIVSLGAAYREEAYPATNPFPLVAIHGVKDTIIPIERSEESFRVLLSTGKITGEYHRIEGLDHNINAEASDLLMAKTEELFGK